MVSFAYPPIRVYEQFFDGPMVEVDPVTLKPFDKKPDNTAPAAAETKSFAPASTAMTSKTSVSEPARNNNIPIYEESGFGANRVRRPDLEKPASGVASSPRPL